MLKKQLRKIISLIIITAFVGRLASPLAVLAQSSPPEAPSAPSAPSGPGSPPQAPSAPSAPSGPSNPPTPPDYTYTYVIPTPPDGGSPAPTGEALPTGEVLPTGEALPTGSQSSADPTTAPGTAGNNSSGYSSGSVNDPYNLTTGPGSYNYGSEIIDQKMEVLNKNLAEIQNKVDALTSSGFNYANLNTLNGEVYTGNVISTVNLMNKLNSNMSGLGTFSTFSLYGRYLGDIGLQFTEGSPLSAFISASETVAKNSITGPMSQNYSISDGNFTVKEANGNDAKLTNDINLGADTGSNSASLNTGNGIIQTGNASALGNIINMVNSNINVSKWLFAVLNIFGELAGNIILPQEDGSSSGESVSGGGTMVGNENTGPMSTNYASATTNNTAEFSNVNNADIVSTLNVDANTGNNEANYNTGGDSTIKTGDVNVAASIFNFVNTNIIGRTLMLGFINVFGSWTGNFITPGTQKENDSLALLKDPPLGGTDDPEEKNSKEKEEDVVTQTNSDDESDDPGSTNGDSKKTKRIVYIRKTPNLYPQFSYPSSQMVQGISTTNPGFDLPKTKGASKNVVSVNLAWLILLLPCVILWRIRKGLIKNLAYTVRLLLL